MLKNLRIFNTKDQEVDRLYVNVRKFASQFTDKAFLDGRLIKDQDLLSAEDNTIDHGLGRDLQGWVIVNKTAQSDVWAETQKQPRPSKSITLNCSADVTVSLYVF